MSEDIELAWAAGFIDGEGCITCITLTRDKVWDGGGGVV